MNVIIALGLMSAGAFLGVAAAAMAAAAGYADVRDEAYRDGYARCLKDHNLAPLRIVPDELEGELLAEFAEADAHVEGSVR